LAIAALACGIPGLCVFPAALAALICGIVALVKAKPGQPKGMAIAGTVLGGLGIVVTPILLMMVILVPVLGRARQLNGNIIVMTNEISVCKGAELYADGNKTWYPGLTTKGERRSEGASGLAHLLADGACVPQQLVSPPHAFTESFPAQGERDLRKLDTWCRTNSAVIFLPDFRPVKSDMDHGRIGAFIDPAMALEPLRIPVVRGDLTSEIMTKAQLDSALTAQYGADSGTLTRKWRNREPLAP
jgi:hypothetical protein